MSFLDAYFNQLSQFSFACTVRMWLSVFLVVVTHGWEECFADIVRDFVADLRIEAT